MNRRLFLGSALLLAGCRPRSKKSAGRASLGAPQHERVLALVLDLSGSFQAKMVDGGLAHLFMTKVLDRYFRASIGTADTMIIAQISGTDRSLIWEGTPAQLRRQFASASDFNTALREKADPNGSRVHDGIRHVVEYMLADQRVATGAAKPAILVLSDMIDSNFDPSSEQKLKQSLTDFGRHGGIVGLYYVDQNLASRWQQTLAGLSEVVVHCEIRGEPPLPNF